MSRRLPRTITFTLRFKDGHVVELGGFRWPFGVRYARLVEAKDGSATISEVFDTRGVATFSLDDVTLGDLEVTR